MQLDLAMALQVIERLGLPLALVIAFIQGWIVPRYVYAQLLESEREFRNITLQSAEIATRAVRATERAVEDRK